MLALLSLVLLVAGVPTAMWLGTRREAEGCWPPRVTETERAGRGAFREAEVPRLVADGPPGAVRAAAMGAWILGTMFLPGLVGGFVGVFFFGVGIVSVPGLILAWRLFFLGAPLLRGEPEAAERARAAARFARELNYVVLFACVIAAATQAGSLARHGLGDALAVLALVASVAGYAAISLAHARLLERAARHVDALHAGPGAEATGIRVVAPALRHEPAAAADEATADEARHDRRRSTGET